MRALLAELRPQAGILGEEFPAKAGTSGRTWVLDPIDGTRGFISGTPTWGTLIAVSGDDGPILGIVDQPYIGERFMGTPSGAMLTRDGQTVDITTNTTVDLSEATIFTTFPEVGTSAPVRIFIKVDLPQPLAPIRP